MLNEQLRNERVFRRMESFWREFWYASRTVRRSPVFSAIVILSLAIGIGGNVAIFNLVDSMLLKSLPVRDPEQLRVLLWTGEGPFRNFNGYRTKNRSGAEVSSSFPYSTYQEFRSKVHEFSDLLGFAPVQVTVTAGGSSYYAEAEFVTGTFFLTLELSTFLGRAITPEDDHVGAPPLAVISYRYWEQQLGMDAGAVGRTIIINGHPVTILGITPKAFHGLHLGDAPAIYLPISLTTVIGGNWYRVGDDDTAWVQVMGRLSPTSDDRKVLAALAVIMERRNEVYGKGNTGNRIPWRPVLQDGAAGVEAPRDRVFPFLLFLSCVVGLVLLAICANLANLFLARSVARRGEIALRLAIGAGRWRLIWQLFIENLILAGLGAGIGLVFAPLLTRLIVSMIPGHNESLDLDVHLDWRALAFTGGIAFVTALIFGLVPAFVATRVDLGPVLKFASTGTMGLRPRLRAGRLLVVTQVALSTVLMACAGLFVRTLLNESRIDPGFQAQRLLLFNVDGSRNGYKGKLLMAFYETIRDRLALIPGVQSVTLSDLALISGNSSTGTVTIPGTLTKDGQAPSVLLLRVGSHFFSTLGIPILRGRGVDTRDSPNATKVGVVNEVFVQRYFQGRNPIGSYLYLGDSSRGESAVQVVGVCRGAKYDDLKHDIEPTLYLAYLQDRDFNGGVTFEIRTGLPMAAIEGTVRRTIAAVDQNVPLAGLRTQESQIRETLGPERLLAGIASSFGALVVVLAAIGLYGVVAYSVARRTAEIGIRMALGAGRAEVRWMMLNEVFWMLGAGVTIGVPAGLVLTRLVQHFLYAVEVNDPLTFIGAATLTTVIVAIAAWSPIERAVRVDPVNALKWG